MRLVAAHGVAERVRQDGGRLFVWPKTAGCCRSRVTYLKVATAAPPGVFRRVAGDGFEVFLDARLRHAPEELHVELHGRRRPRLAAYWNGCAYVI